MAKKYQILLLEDSDIDAELIINELQRQKVVFILRHVKSKKDFIKEINSFNPDIILADYQYKEAFVANSEINRVAALATLMAEIDWK